VIFARIAPKSFRDMFGSVVVKQNHVRICGGTAVKCSDMWGYSVRTPIDPNAARPYPHRSEHSGPICAAKRNSCQGMRASASRFFPRLSLSFLLSCY